jgi:hypothetical protein
MHHTSNCHRVRQQLSRLPHFALLVQSIEIPCIQISVPASHIDQNLLNLRLRQLELLVEATAPQIVVVFVALLHDITHLQVRFIVVRPVFFTAIHRDTTIGALEVYVRGRCAFIGGFACLGVASMLGGASRLVGGMWTVGMLAHKRSAFPYRGYGRVGEGVEQVILVEHHPAVFAFGVDIIVWFKCLLKFAAGGRGETPLRQRELGVRRGFGGVSSPRGESLGRVESRGRRWPQLVSWRLDQRQTSPTGG